MTLPDFLEPHLAARNAVTADGPALRDRERACSSPTAAACTSAEDLRTEERVVLKEARPHAGLDVPAGTP